MSTVEKEYNIWLDASALKKAEKMTDFQTISFQRKYSIEVGVAFRPSQGNDKNTFYDILISCFLLDWSLVGAYKYQLME